MSARTTTVYRSGAVATPTERGCEATSYAAADAVRPNGHPSRVQAIFASPTLSGVARWVRGNAMVGNSDIKVRQITVDPDTAMVYEVREWERASSIGTPAAYASFWDTGMTVSAWLNADLDPSEWEIMLDEADVLGIRPVSDKRLLAAIDDDFWMTQTKTAMTRKGVWSATR